MLYEFLVQIKVMDFSFYCLYFFHGKAFFCEFSSVNHNSYAQDRPSVSSYQLSTLEIYLDLMHSVNLNFVFIKLTASRDVFAKKG